MYFPIDGRLRQECYGVSGQLEQTDEPGKEGKANSILRHAGKIFQQPEKMRISLPVAKMNKVTAF